MCLSDLGRVVEFDPRSHQAVVDVDGRRMPVSTIALGIDHPELRPGDWLIVHTGLAIELVSTEEADAIRRARHEGPTSPTNPAPTEEQRWS